MWFRIFAIVLVLVQGVLSAYIPFEDFDAFKAKPRESTANNNNVPAEDELDESALEELSNFPQLVEDFPNRNYRLANLGPLAPLLRLAGTEADNVNKRFPPHLEANSLSRFWVRSGVECPRTPDGSRQFFCPKPAADGRWICVDDHELCDGVKNCPNADDESPLVCMFYKAMLSQISFVANGITSRSHHKHTSSDRKKK